MASLSLSQNKIFVDSSFLIALHVPSDSFHQRASDLSYILSEDSTSIVTTRAVLLEVGNALSRKQHRSKAAQTLSALEGDSNVKIVEISQELYLEALELFENFTDKQWGIIDCLSFIIMRQEALVVALTTDHHFEQAGFRVLLREEQS